MARSQNRMDLIKGGSIVLNSIDVYWSETARLPISIIYPTFTSSSYHPLVKKSCGQTELSLSIKFQSLKTARNTKSIPKRFPGPGIESPASQLIDFFNSINEVLHSLITIFINLIVEPNSAYFPSEQGILTSSNMVRSTSNPISSLSARSEKLD